MVSKSAKAGLTMLSSRFVEAHLHCSARSQATMAELKVITLATLLRHPRTELGASGEAT